MQESYASNGSREKTASEMAVFSHVIVVGRKRDGSPDIMAKVPIHGEAARTAEMMLLIPDYKGTSTNAYALAYHVAAKFEPAGGGG